MGVVEEKPKTVALGVIFKKSALIHVPCAGRNKGRNFKQQS
jgi:hypothetical protein